MPDTDRRRGLSLAARPAAAATSTRFWRRRG